jgi:ATP-dependent DNA ligase
LQYIGGMLWRNSRGRPINAPAAFFHPCRPIVAKQPPTGPGWTHELKHDGYRLQVHVRDGPACPNNLRASVTPFTQGFE